MRYQTQEPVEQITKPARHNCAAVGYGNPATFMIPISRPDILQKEISECFPLS